MSDLLLVAEQHVHIHTCRQVVHTYKLLQRVSSIFFFDQTIRHLNREEGKKEQKRSGGGVVSHAQAGSKCDEKPRFAIAESQLWLSAMHAATDMYSARYAAHTISGWMASCEPKTCTLHNGALDNTS